MFSQTLKSLEWILSFNYLKISKKGEIIASEIIVFLIFFKTIYLSLNQGN